MSGPKSRSRKQMASDAFDRMSYDDRVMSNFDAALGVTKSAAESVQKRAGAPGAFTVAPSGDIHNSATEEPTGKFFGGGVRKKKGAK